MSFSPSSPENEFTAKGDIEAATSATTTGPLHVGTDGQVLTAASGQSTGLQWVTPTSSGLARTVKAKSATYTAVTGDIVLATTTAPFTVTLPPVAANAQVDIKKVSADANAVTISPQSGTIDGAASITLSTQYASRSLMSDGTNWFLI